jgi:hypothetical protein
MAFLAISLNRTSVVPAFFTIQIEGRNGEGSSLYSCVRRRRKAHYLRPLQLHRYITDSSARTIKEPGSDPSSLHLVSIWCTSSGVP